MSKKRIPILNFKPQETENENLIGDEAISELVSPISLVEEKEEKEKKEEKEDKRKEKGKGKEEELSQFLVKTESQKLTYVKTTKKVHKSLELLSTASGIPIQDIVDNIFIHFLKKYEKERKELFNKYVNDDV